MATKKTSSTSKKKSARQTKAQKHAQNQLLAVVLFTVGLLFAFMAFIKGNSGWLAAHNVLLGLFGPAAYFIGPVFVYIAVMASLEKVVDGLPMRSALTGITILMISAAGQIFLSGPATADTAFGVVRELYSQGQVLKGGGLASAIFGIPLMKLGKPGDAIGVCLLLFALIMVITRSTIAGLLKAAKKPVDKIADSYQDFVSAIPQREPAPQRRAVIDIPLGENSAPVIPEKKNSSKKKKLLDASSDMQPTPLPIPDIEVTVTEEEPLVLAPIVPDSGQQLDIEDIIKRVEANEQEALQGEIPADATEGEPAVVEEGEKSPEELQPSEPPVYVMPPLTLLREPQAVNSDASSAEELRQNAQRLVDTLQSFGVQTRIVDISRGPAVTRYELQPSAGVKISKITNLADDIALNLAAAGVRIEAPIPNKAAVGIEIPNKHVSPVTLREVIDSTQFTEAKSRVSIALGRDVSGNVVLADIAKMPHLLIAGATGSGKSVCINSIIMSILYKAKPDEVKLMLVDPKVVELGVYNGLPHLVVPVVNDAKKAAGVLGWAVTEMLHRYQLFAQHGTREITSFNKLAATHDDLEALPHIVIIVDELADLMMAAPADVEDHICRLAQMARAAGMHLIIATQRPSVDVITGIIKANIPSRIAFAVSSQVDSRTILDMGGAEKLLGAGDMLFYPVGSSKPVRVQGCYVSDDEIERVVSFIKGAQAPVYDQQVLEEIDRHTPVAKGSSGGSSDSEGGDEMVDAAIDCVLEAGIASTSLLQRKCKLGYARAARIIDELEERGIVGPFEGSKPRQVLISKERWIEMKLNRSQNT